MGFVPASGTLRDESLNYGSSRCFLYMKFTQYFDVQLTVIPIFFIRKQAFMFCATPSRRR